MLQSINFLPENESDNKDIELKCNICKEFTIYENISMVHDELICKECQSIIEDILFIDVIEHLDSDIL